MYKYFIIYRIPIITKVSSRESRDIGDLDDNFFDEEPSVRINKTAFEPSVHAPSKAYCSIFNSFQKACLFLSILDIWEFDSNLIRMQTKEDIIEKLNSIRISPTLGHPINYTELLGGISRDKKGRIVSATAVKTEFMVHVNFSNVKMDETGNDAGTADWVRYVYFYLHFWFNRCYFHHHNFFFFYRQQRTS